MSGKRKGDNKMGYVKGCDITLLSNYTMKMFDSGKLVLADGLKDFITVDELKGIVAAANGNFVDPEGKEIKGRQAGLVYVLMKKVDKQKQIMGFAYMKRYAGEPTDKTGLAKVFANSTDSYRLEERMFASGFEAEEQYFDESVLSHLRDYVSYGQVKEAEYLDKMVVKKDKMKFLGTYIGEVVYFIAMMVIWGFVFHNIGLGICFALLFTTSFTMIVSKNKTEAKDVAGGVGGEVSGAVDNDVFVK